MKDGTRLFFKILYLKFYLMSNKWTKHFMISFLNLILWMSCCNTSKKAYLKSLGFVPDVIIWEDRKFVGCADEIFNFYKLQISEWNHYGWNCALSAQSYCRIFKSIWKTKYFRIWFHLTPNFDVAKSTAKYDHNSLGSAVDI